MNPLSFSKKLTWLTLFSIAMGFLETAVVIYLRKLYYPDGFNFPLVPIEPSLALVELIREAATILMLAGIGILVGRSKLERFAVFIYCFAVWDIFYYIFLKLFLDWPASLFTWDILFLLPVPWVGPVLAPCLVALTFVGFALYIMRSHEKGLSLIMNPVERWLFVLGSFIIIGSFIAPYAAYIQKEHQSAWLPGSNKDLFQEISHFIPNYYDWLIFCIGEFGLLLSTTLFILRTFKNKRAW